MADHLIDARSQTGTAPDEKRKCGIQPAHQSLFTDVFSSRPPLCTIHPVPQLHASTRGEDLSRALCLTWDIRGFQATLLPRSATPAERVVPRL